MDPDEFSLRDDDIFDNGMPVDDNDNHGTTGGIHAERLHESSMRLATDISVEDQKSRRRNRKMKITARRGAFKFLPVYCSNDLVHGSWWFVVGSVLATVIPIVPLVDLFYPFWASKAQLPLLSDATTFGLLIVSGAFFTFGSLALPAPSKSHCTG